MVRVWLLILGLLCCACDGVQNDPGLAGSLRVRGAQYVEAGLPKAGDGPEIVALRVPHAQVLPGLRRELLSGSLPADAEAVLVTRVGDPGYWIVGAGAASIEEPELATFSAELSFARDLPPGALVLELAAVGRNGAVGPLRTVMLEAQGSARSDFLSIELRWDSDADLDLHVVVPGGEELWPGDLNTYAAPPPGASAPDPNAYRAGATLDLDSNGNCLLDGRRQERASWPVEPGSGLYTVRVATASLCGAAVAHWTLEVWRGGKLLQTAQGLSQSVDTRQGAGRGAGVLVLELVVP